MYAGSRFGQDTKTRIAASSEMLMEATEQLPEPQYQPLIPFLPPSISTGGQISGGASGSQISSGSGGEAEWKEYPDRLDLHVYQGDDVQIPLYFRNPGEPLMDLSNENGYAWKSQIRVVHRYYSTLINEFTIESSLILPDPEPAEQVNTTLVTLFLPRYHNQYPGVYSWDLCSTSAYTGPVFPDEPPHVPNGEWPMVDQVKTWLYGYVYVVPRVTQTDYLPLPGNTIWTGATVVVSPTGVFGPNGRVP